MQLANAADIRTQQQQAATSHFLEQLEMTSAKPQPRTVNGNRCGIALATGAYTLVVDINMVLVKQERSFVVCFL